MVLQEQSKRFIPAIMEGAKTSFVQRSDIPDAVMFRCENEGRVCEIHF
jgi:hypothetical protein